jgi:hypothetical protein
MKLSFEHKITEFIETIVKDLDPVFYDEIQTETFDSFTDYEKIETILNRLSENQCYLVNILKNNYAGDFNVESVKKALTSFKLVFFIKLTLIHLKCNDFYFFRKPKIDEIKSQMISYVGQIISEINSAIDEKIIDHQLKIKAHIDLEDFIENLDSLLEEFD